MQQVAQLAGHTFRVSWPLSSSSRCLNVPDAPSPFPRHLPGPLSRLLARWTDDRHGCRRRNLAVLERVPKEQDGAEN